MTARRVHSSSDGLNNYDADDGILIIDSGCDQSIINKNNFVILSRTGLKFCVGGALQERMGSSAALEVVNGATLVTLGNGNKFIAVVNQALFDIHPAQTEAFLQPHQCRSFGTVVDDCSKHHLGADGSSYGGQCIKVSDQTIPLYFNGWFCYLAISKPSQADLDQYPHITLTSPQPYEPKQRYFTRRVATTKQANVSIEEWRRRLGYPTMDVAKKTIAATTNLVTTVEAESRDYMRDHLKARLLPLRPHRINDVCYSDTFFASITSCRGYTMWQFFSFQNCELDVPYLMKRKSQA